MFRKGCNIKRSLSPVMMASAPADIARDKNILSFGSLQAIISLFISTASAAEIIFSIKDNLISSDKYFPDLGLQKTVKYSALVSADTNRMPVCLAIFNARPGGESSFSNALNKELVSNIQYLVLIFQQVIQLVRSKTFGIIFFGSFFHNIKKLFISGFVTEKIVQPGINYRFSFYGRIRFFKSPGNERGNWN